MEWDLRIHGGEGNAVSSVQKTPHARWMSKHLDDGDDDGWVGDELVSTIFQDWQRLLYLDDRRKSRPTSRYTT